MKNLFILLIAVFLISCKGASDPPPEVPIEEPSTGFSIALSGSAQKGPFEIDTVVNIQGTDTNFQEIVGEVASPKIKSRDGAFSDSINFTQSSYANVNIEGYFFNELTGSWTGTLFKLHSFMCPSVTVNNFNLATNLIKERVKVLIATGSTCQSAFTQSTNELVIELLSISWTGPSANNWTILDDSPLLALSSLILSYAQAGQPLQSWTANVADDFKDGVISQAYKDHLITVSVNLNTIAVRSNVDGFFTAGSAKDINRWLLILDPSRTVAVANSQGSGVETKPMGMGTGATDFSFPFKGSNFATVSYPFYAPDVRIFTDLNGLPDQLVSTGVIGDHLPVKNYPDANGTLYGITSFQAKFTGLNLTANGNYHLVLGRSTALMVYYSLYEQVPFGNSVVSTDNMATWILPETATPKLTFLTE